MHALGKTAFGSTNRQRDKKNAFIDVNKPKNIPVQIYPPDLPFHPQRGIMLSRARNNLTN